MHVNVQHGVRLDVHMGVGAGRLACLYVGGVYGRWEYVVAVSVSVCEGV